ncbi:probable G-protein coupled receptor 139 [Mercenaria mercenaria]|uniref:probable G-protein coupled receptor 139 n=1 Tax=Mercenaria mercenaria TaxID=6596 RepID=UPI00234F94E3|nr:probable G-protein coupled receptor 139 [Mercenaria mercenaria]
MEITKSIAYNNTHRILPLNSSEDARNDSVEMTITFSISQQGTNLSLTDFTEYKIAEFMEDHYRYFISAIGIPGNLACIVVLIFMKLKLSSYLFMMALAITDLTAILLILSYRLLDENNVRLGDRFCQVIFFAGTTSQMYPNWILVAMTIERFIAVKFPFKFKTICVRKNAVFVIVILLVSIISANAQFLFTFEAVQGSFPCGPKERYGDFIHFVWYWIDGALYAIIPLSVILVLNSLIIYDTRKSRKTLTARGRSSHECTRMLLTTTIVFVLLVLPNCLFFICRGYWNWRKTSHSIAQYHLVYQIVFMLSDLNHAINFYLYCLSGRNFREKFLQLLCLRWRRRPTRPNRSI